MYNNDIIIEKLKQSLFQDDENAFNDLFSPFVQENNSDDIDLTSMKDKIVIKNEKDINFFIENKSENKEVNSDDEKIDDETTDDDDDDYANSSDDDDDDVIIKSHMVTSGNQHKISRLTSSSMDRQAKTKYIKQKPKPKPKAKPKSKLKRKIVMM